MTTKKTCGRCGGEGVILVVPKKPSKVPELKSCPKCNGTGEVKLG